MHDNKETTKKLEEELSTLRMQIAKNHQELLKEIKQQVWQHYNIRQVQMSILHHQQNALHQSQELQNQNHFLSPNHFQ